MPTVFPLDRMLSLITIVSPFVSIVIVMIAVSSRTTIVPVTAVCHRFDRHHTPDQHAYKNKDRRFHGLLLLSVGARFVLLVKSYFRLQSFSFDIALFSPRCLVDSL
jgi:hypothetical protein